MAVKAAAARFSMARVFSLVEDVIYLGLGAILGVSALVLLGESAVLFGRSVAANALAGSVITLLDRLLLILLIVELMYTVQVSFRERALVAEPFLLIGLIAAIRRVIVLSAELPQLVADNAEAAQHFLVELGLFTGMILILVICLVVLRRHPRVTADRA